MIDPDSVSPAPVMAACALLGISLEKLLSQAEEASGMEFVKIASVECVGTLDTGGNGELFINGDSLETLVLNAMGMTPTGKTSARVTVTVELLRTTTVSTGQGGRG